VASPGSTGQNVLQRGSLTVITNNGGADFGSASGSTPGAVPGATLSVSGPSLPAVTGLALAPNPFRSTIGLSLKLATAAPTPVWVAVFDVTGRRVRTLMSGQVLSPGTTQLAWSGDDDQGRSVPSGAYLFRVTTPSGVSVVRGVRLQ
jgi:hypothetical protein